MIINKMVFAEVVMLLICIFGHSFEITNLKI